MMCHRYHGKNEKRYATLDRRLRERYVGIEMCIHSSILNRKGRLPKGGKCDQSPKGQERTEPFVSIGASA
jgi:hypothetical protein